MTKIALKKISVNWPKTTSKLILTNKHSGIIYKVQKIDKELIMIKKVSIENGKIESRLEMGSYIVWQNKIFNSPDLKDLLKTKIQNVCSLINKMGQIVSST